MKNGIKGLVAALALSVSIYGWPMDINQYHSGSWWNSSQSGHGFSIEVLDENTVLIYWYVYNPDGSSTFLLAVAEISGNSATGTTYYYSGMRFGDFDPNDVNEQVWGTVTITFHSCDSATLQYSSTLSYNGDPFGSGQIPLTRLVSIDKMQCSNSPYAGLYQGNFFSDATQQIIPGVALLVPNGDVVAVSYDGVAAYGSWSVSNGSINMSGFGISMDPDNYQKGNFTANGVIQADHRLIGDYSVTGGDFGTADLFATPSLYRRGASLSGISGNYTATNLISGFQANISISASGSLSGQDVSTSCTYSGQIQIGDQRFNILSLTVTVTNCGNNNGQYQGYGMVDDYLALGDGRLILLSATNGTYAAVIQLVK